ncbi:magnesium transporter MRS2-E-like [Phragmites australis]|uniref:magnesium transporter MRS2-E-like n=1 Tax=Phragmites australis TaxID=29695 RepID=UPI002D77701E|nr:magnesium transporter MRS2-E-like [Phragmites australis]
MERRQPAPQPPPPRRKGAVASREWLVVPAAGEARTREFGKHQIMEMTGLPARDLRVLDPLLSYPSTILGRDRAVVVNLEHVKAIVTANEALVPNPGNPLLRPFLSDLHARLVFPDLPSTSPATDRGTDTEQSEGNGPTLAAYRSGSVKFLPFEFKVLEVCLEYTCKCLESETLALEKEAYPALDELTSKVSTLNLEHVRQIKSRLVELSGRVQKVRDELEHLLDDDIDMSEMYLTRKLTFQGLSESLGMVDSNKDAPIDHDEEKEEEDHDDETESGRESSVYIKPNIEELEMLLEAYFVQVDGTLNKLYNLREYVDDTEDYINIMLDEKQNQLLQMGVMLTTATVVVTAGIAVVSLFGMNIHIDLMKAAETDEEARIKNMKFWETTWGTVAGCVVIYLLAIYAGKKSKILQ